MSDHVVHLTGTELERNRVTLHAVEGLALVMLCSSKPIIRKQAIIMLKESRNLFTLLDVPKVISYILSTEFCRVPVLCGSVSQYKLGSISSQ